MTYKYYFCILLSAVSAAFAETIKASEPISTVLLGAIFLHDSNSLRTYITLLPICIGVAIACYNSHEALIRNGYLGGFLALSSNFCFSSRAVLAKKLNITYPNDIDEIEMFRLISIRGTLILIPITIIVEGWYIFKLFRADFTGSFGWFSMLNRNSWLLLTALLNGTMFAAYNLVSYLVLKRADLITHSVLNAFRRVFVILSAAYFFDNPLSFINVAGILLAVTGVGLFGWSKAQDKLVKGDIQR